MIKVTHLTYDMRIGGTEMVVKNILDSTLHLLDQSIFCIEAPLGPWGVELQENGVSVTQYNRKPGFDLTLIKKIRTYIKENKIDILHCHQYTPWVYGSIAAMFTKTKVVFTEHGRFYPDTSSWKRKLVNPILCLFTNQTTAISKATKQALVEYENIPEKTIQVVYNGIAPLKFDKNKIEKIRADLKIPDENIILGTVARFDPIKNHTMMLEAFAQILTSFPNSTLLIVGDGEERKNIEKSIQKLNITKNVILTGYKPKPADYIALMDIFLLSSLSEGTSMTLLEAMSIGKPCIVTDAGGNPEIVQNGENGYVSINNDPLSFAQNIQKVLSSEALRKSFSKNARSRFQLKFSQKKMLKEYQEIYENVSK